MPRSGRVEIVQTDDATYSWRWLRVDGLVLDVGGPHRTIWDCADDARATTGLANVTFRPARKDTPA
jgi:hypothetical protein